MSIFQELIYFIRKGKKSPEPAPFAFSNFFKLLFLAFLVVIPYAWLLDAIDLDQFDHKMDEYIEKYPILIFIMAVIVAPLLEEGAFRYHLIPTKSKVWISIFLSLFFISSSWLIGAIVIAYFLYVLIQVERGTPPSLLFLLYGSTFTFAIIHLSNFSNFEFQSHFYYIPLLVGIQFILGLVLAFLRIHYGMWYAIAFHAAYNGTAMGIVLIGLKFFES